jgi:single-strand DNA-binding protein
MAGETIITVIGNLTGDPELRFTPSGAAVVSFTVAATPRTYDKDTNKWKDGEALFLRCSAWRNLAENVAESLTKGTRVMVQGRLKQRSYEGRDGERRTVIELEAEEVGPSLKFASARVNRAERRNDEPQQQASGFGAGEPAAAPADDPWTTPARAAGTPVPDEPPF